MTPTTASPGEQFVEVVRRLREIDQTKAEACAFTQPILEGESVLVGDVVYLNFWFQHDDGHIWFLSLADIPGTLSGDILRLKRNLPTNLQRNASYSIVGDDIRPLPYAPPVPLDADDSDPEAMMSAALALLPLVPVDPQINFLKKPNYASEIHNRLSCLGGTCPGTPQSPNILPLLGKSSAGELVFPKLDTNWRLYGDVHPLETYKAWILDLIDGLRALHARGIVHRDICTRNFLWSDSDSTSDAGRVPVRLLISDLEGRWGLRQAPELRARMPRIPMANHSDAVFENLVDGWTVKSDVYDLGKAIVQMLYAAPARPGFVERPVPPPLDAIVAACTRAEPEDRPSLEELHDMVEGIVC